MKPLFLSLLIIAGVLSISSNTLAQTGTIKGTLIHASDDSAFEQVNVALYSLPDSSLITGTATGPDGSFTIGPVATGTYYLIARFVGFTPYNRNITLTADQPSFDAGTIRLVESTQELEGVEVVTAKPEVVYQADKKILNVAQIKQTGATTLVEVLENAPGITTDTEGNVLLRGSSNYRLLIDGRPSPVSGTSLLKQLPVDMVENIEIMTNPSAKYDAEGAAGIINLVLKKQKSAGFMAQATLMAGLNNKYLGDFQANYRKNKYNLFGGISVNSIETLAEGFIERTLYDSLQSVDRYSELFQAVKVQTINGHAGLDYNFNDRNSISLSGRLGKMTNHVDVENEISLGITDDPYTQWLLYSNVLNLDGTFYNPQFNYRHKFDDKGHQIDFDVFTGGFSGILTQEMYEYPSDSLFNPGNNYNTKNQTINDLSTSDTRIKTDYVKPFESGNKIEAGAQVTLFRDYTNFRYQDIDEVTQEWVINPDFSNEFLLKRYIYAGYGIWSGKLSKFSYSLGLRGEYTDRMINQITLDEYDRTGLMSIFPSGSASMELPKDQSLQFSFSRRINRPAGMMLNPFPQYVDNQTIRVGNPDLAPEFIQSYELAYQKQTKLGLVTSQVYYRRVKDVSSFGMTLNESGQVILLPLNANRSHSTGLELTGNIMAAQWLRFMASSNLYYYVLQDESMLDNVANETVSWNARLNSMFMFGANTRFVVSANYTGPTVMLQGRMGGNFLLNLGLTQMFFKRQATLTLGVRDILKTGRTRLENYSEGLTVITEMFPEAPMVTLTFTYNLNNFQQRVEEEQLDLNFIR